MATKLDRPPQHPEPLPDDVTSIQPGGGFCMRIELAWGQVRRAWLRAFRPRYVERMRSLRKGDCPNCPHDVVDPRDLKYLGNVCGFSFDPADDPFRWRSQLPFARWGLGELILMAVPLAAATIASAITWWYAAPVFGTLLLFVLCFFRDPPRRIPEEAGVLVAPADGKITDVEAIDDVEFVGGPAVRIGIFLSIFSVHVNRAPLAARVMRVQYTRGKFLNALRPESARENERMSIGLEALEAPEQRVVVNQIAGAIARRIVCDLRPGQPVSRGERIGMIKLGSRTELIVARAPGLQIEVKPGDRVAAGRSVLARFRGQEHT